jgi:hypothetical protein
MNSHHDRSTHLKELIYESPDGGKTIRIRRSSFWNKNQHTEFQLVELLDMLVDSERDPSLKEMISQAVAYWTLKHR